VNAANAVLPEGLRLSAAGLEVMLPGYDIQKSLTK
jgi:hypothetical protein